MVKIVREKCECSGTWMVVGSCMEGHCLQFTLQCNNCGTCNLWNGSNQHPDHSFEVNRNIVRAWLSTGGERGKYFQFCEAMRCGVYNRTSFDQTVELLVPIILELEDQSYKLNIDSVNESKDGCILGFDCQHSRSQRATGAAPLATSTFICHTPGNNYGKILYQSHLSTHQIKEMEMKGTESKDKWATHAGLKKLVGLVNHIVKGVCDGSSSGNKLWSDIVTSNSKHKQALLANCSWHKIKGLAKDFKTKILDKRIKLAQKEGRKQYKPAFPEIEELDITGQRIKNHWIYSQKTSFGDPDQMEMVFRSLSDDYQEITEGAMSDETKEALDDWLKQACQHMEKYSDGLLGLF